MSEAFTKYDGMDIVPLVREMKELKIKLEEADKVKKELQKEFDFLRLNKIPDVCDEMGIERLSVEGVGRLSLTSDFRVSIIGANKEKAYEWLVDNRHGDLITNTVNSSSLKAMVKDATAKGEELPDELFKIYSFTRASITKT
jgi:hypothetical protein